MTNNASTPAPAAHPRRNGHQSPTSAQMQLKASAGRTVAQAPAGLTRAVLQWTAGIKPTWTVSEVRSALKQHALGDFSQSALLWESMGEDDCIPGLIDKRINRLLGEEFDLCPVEEKGKRKSTSLAKRFGPGWWDYFPEGELADLLRWKHGLGVAVGTLDWDITASEWTPRLRTLHPRWLRYDDTRGQWVFQSRDGDLVVTPGDGRWILLCDGSRGWMQGFVRSLGIDWIAKQLTARDWNRYNERHGLPLIKAKAPAVADDEDREDFFDNMQTLGSESVALLLTNIDEQGAAFDLELLEASDRNWSSFKDQIERFDRKFTIRIIGANLGTEINDTGAFAASESHNEVLRELAHADGQKVTTELRWQGLYPLCALNEPDVKLEVVPWPKWATEAIGDAGEQATGQKAFGEALQQVHAGIGSGLQITNIAELAEAHGIRLEERPPEEDEAAAPVDKATVGAQTDAIIKLIDAVNAKQMPRDTAVNVLVTVFGMSLDEADKLLGDVGKSFTPAPLPGTEPTPAPTEPEPEPVDPNGDTDPAPALDDEDDSLDDEGDQGDDDAP